MSDSNWFEKVVLGPSKTNCYILRDGNDLAIIDPCDEKKPKREDREGKLMEALNKYNLKDVKLKVILTHGHHDHISGIPNLFEHFRPLDIYVSQYDVPLLTNPRLNGSQDNVNLSRFKEHFHTLTGDGEEIQIGSIKLRAVAVAGHTPGGLFLINDAARSLFSGDSLFKGAIGISNPIVLMGALRYATKNIPDDYRVFPGHGEPTTIGQERENGTF